MSTSTKKFWRIDPDSLRVDEPPAVVTMFPRFTKDVRIGDGVVWARWDQGQQKCRVTALGHVIGKTIGGITIDWRSKIFPLNPSASGAIEWEKEALFKFVPKVVKEHKLPFHFDLVFRPDDNKQD